MPVASERIVVHPNQYAVTIHDPKPMATSPAPVATTPVADTLGWDTVFAITLPNVNSALRQPAASPGNFDAKLASNYAISGTFGDWQVTMGGDGQDVYLLVPVKSGTLNYLGTSYSMDGSVATVVINFDFLPGQPAVPPVPTSASGTEHHMKAKTRSQNPAIDPIASVVQFSFPEGNKSSGNTPVHRALFQGALTQWFIENLARFNHVFSTVNLAQKSDEASFQWLKPSLTSYAYADGTTPDNSILGVLTTTQRRTIGDLSHEIVPDAIPVGAQSGFLISSNLFLKESVLPGLPHAFKNASAENFQLSNDGTEIVLAPGAVVDMNTVTHDGTPYFPKLKSFNLQVNDTEIVTNMKVAVNISPGIDITIYLTTYQTLVLVNKPDGTQTLGYKNTRPMKHTYTKHVAAWVKITIAVVSLIVAIVGVFIAGPAAEIAEMIVIAIVVAIIVGIITGIEMIIEDVIAKGVANAMPAINPLIYAATDPIVWPTAASKFTLTSATLNGSIQLGGTLHFSRAG